MHSRRPVLLTRKPFTRDGVGLDQLLEAQIDGIDAELFGDFVELDFQRKARLRRAVAALRAARRFIREHAHALEFVRRHIVSHGLQRAGVIDGRQAVTAVAAAVEIGFVLHRLDRAVVFHAGLGKHLDRDVCRDGRKTIPRG